MNNTTRRRMLSGELGPDAQRLALDQIAGEIPPSSSVLTPRQKAVAILVAALLIASMIALIAMRLAAPAKLAHR
jgi:hypothetical protein